MKKMWTNLQRLNEQGELENTALVLENGHLVSFEEINDADEVLDGEGKLLLPGLIDIHVHLREPGGEHKETIESGTLAAAKGGFTTLCAMPNTRPVPDTTETMSWLMKRIEDTAHVRVLPYGSITIREAGKELTNAEDLKAAGAFALTDDGVGVQSAGMMYQAMQQAAKASIPVVAHCEDNSLLFGGVMHEGIKNKELELPGILSASEAVHIARDILLAEATGAHYHVCHVSTKESVRVIRDAKRAGIHVTAEVSPHHLMLCEDDIPENEANWKMNPPLRGKEDRQALLAALEDGTLDCIATDHAPHTSEEKAHGFDKAPFGIVGLETAFPLLYTHFVATGKWSLQQLVDYLTTKPANVFNLPYGKLQLNQPAEFTLIDVNAERAIDTTTFVSKSTNTPFAGWNCKGWPTETWFNGKCVWREQS
ncbi:dihydroorotase [Chryseomicrobium sp. FSL W7-1435]|uniref:dihydroorotase n=1 Tax=Chryseomicrobium sp. FSL W7-1435 TaxID=2921704 RepID=UPI003159E705